MRIQLHAAAALFTLALAACGNAPPVQDGATEDAATTDDIEAALAALPDAEAAAQLSEVRALTAPYQDLAVAQTAGYAMLVPGCRDNQPTGGMGWHYANPELIDGNLDPRRPEALVYEPQADGTQQLVGVEWVVPYVEHGREADPPMLFGEQFLHNDNDQLWMLHVWLWRSNPSGMFATWHPNVSCAHAAH
jgi:hypothetical protein